MFEQDYKKAMDAVKPDADKKNEILNNIKQKENAKTQKNPAMPWRVAFACVALVAIILGVVFVPKNNIVTKPKNSPNTLSVADSYDEIYSRLKKYQKQHKNYEIADGEVVYEYAYDDAEGSETGTNSGANYSSGSALKGDSQTSENTAEENEFSGTTEQVEGVSEADIVKTDGKYIYTVNDNFLSIFSASGSNSQLLSRTELENEENAYVYGDMFLKDDRLVILQNSYGYNGAYSCVGDCMASGDDYTSIIIFDISDRKEPKQVAVTRQKGYYNTSRMVGDYVYLVSECYINTNNIVKEEPDTYVPTVVYNDKTTVLPADRIYCYNYGEDSASYSVIGSFNYRDGALCDSASLFGGASQIYCSKDNIIFTKYNSTELPKEEGSYSSAYTDISRLEISGGKIEYKASGKVEGELENQFFIDEYDGYFRFVTTVTETTVTKQKYANTDKEIFVYDSNPSACLTVLDKDLKLCGQIKDLAQGERVYSVRFMGDTAYFVTFRRTDPLFSADLSDPKNPKILGELKIPGFSEYMYPYGNGLLLGFGMDADESTGRTNGLKLSMFDISNPADVKEQNKTVLDGYDYSPALYNHKAMLVSSSKNLMGFAAYDRYGNTKYLIYEYTGDEFVRKAVLTPPYAVQNSENNIIYDSCFSSESIRGLFINNDFYLVSDCGLLVFDMNTFLQTARIDF